jgi:hypothetical protein
MDQQFKPDGWKVTYPEREWCVYEKNPGGGREAEWSADGEGVNCALRCSGYNGYSDASLFPWTLLAELAATQGYELRKKPAEEKS